MLNIFMKYVLGGKSNKREISLFAFLVSLGWTSYYLYHIARGVDMSEASGLITMFLTVTFAGCVGTTSLHFMKPDKVEEEPGETIKDPFASKPKKERNFEPKPDNDKG